jgi:hypothetical protein
VLFNEAPWLEPAKKSAREEQLWWDIPVEGSIAHDFSKQIFQLDLQLQSGWQTKSSPKSGNPI